MSHSRHNSAIVLLSAGLDSVVSLAIARERLDVRFAVTFDYGQRTSRQELKSARAICRYYNVLHHRLDISWLGRVSKSALTQKQEVGIGRLLLVNDVWVPNRNSIFLSIGAALAEAGKIRYVITGFNREEGQDFLDNSRKFVNLFNRSLALSTLNHVRVKSYVQNLNKIQIVKLGIEHKVPFELIYSCYLGKANMCGRCLSCQRLRNALRDAGALKYLKKLFSR